MVEIGSLVIDSRNLCSQSVRIVHLIEFEVRCMQTQTRSQSEQEQTEYSGHPSPSSFSDRVFHVCPPDAPVAPGAHTLSGDQKSSIPCVSRFSPTFLTGRNQ